MSIEYCVNYLHSGGSTNTVQSGKEPAMFKTVGRRVGLCLVAVVVLSGLAVPNFEAEGLAEIGITSIKM
jgi:hypothetical protein